MVSVLVMCNELFLLIVSGSDSTLIMALNYRKDRYLIVVVKEIAVLSHIPPYAGDPILSLMETFRTDNRPDKVNLSIGLYYDDNGKIPTLESVHHAKALIRDDEPCVYLPMEGLESYRNAVQELVFGTDHPALKDGRVVTIQSLGGSGALMIGADFIHHFFSEAKVWISDPSWENHHTIFAGSGMSVGTYPYFDDQTKMLDFSRMCDALSALPAESVVLFHPCCHNPTGVDLTQQQWDEVSDIIVEHQLIPFFDMAYQGYGDSMDDDAYVVRTLAKRNDVTFFVANSFSKTFSLYAERIGGLSVVCRDDEMASRVLGQLKAAVRRNYSSPAKFGAVLVSHVLNVDQLKTMWLNEVDTMRIRIQSMRQALYERLQALCPQQDFRFIVKQKGMFSYTGFSSAQVHELRERYGIYLIASGRMCLAGLNHHNVMKVAEAFAAVSSRTN